MTTTPTPTGRILPTAEGRDLVLTRTFRSGIEDVWASITESERTGRWFATWTGEPGPGKTIRYRMTFEGDAPEAEMRIDACEPPHHLAVSAEDDYGHWRLEARLEEADGVTTLTFTQHLDEKANPGEVGPGWEFYLDNLVAAHTDTRYPNFDDYFPSMKPYYESLP
jgi:uncharacterized protein YndB with AHSA1/START domain